MKKLESILALDLGSNNIKLIETQIKGAKLFVNNYSVTAVPHELREVESVNSPAYIDFIKNLISEKGLTAKSAVVCISHPLLEVKDLILPIMSQKELKTGIDWQIRDALSIPIEEAVADYIVQGDLKKTEGKEMDLCIAAIPKKIADEYVSFLQAINLNPLAFVIEPQSARQFLKDCPEFKDKKTIALVNMGAEKTIISVFSNNKLKLMRILPICGNKFTDGIVQRVVTTKGERLDKERAEFLKCKYGISAVTGAAEEDINYHDIFSALRPSLEDLVSELMRFLEYYKSEHVGENIEIIAVYGGASMLKGISDYISKNIGIPVVLPKLVDLGLSKVVNKEEFNRFGAFLINTVGASLLGEKAINLLPPVIKNIKKLKHEKAAWIKAWIAFISAVSIIYAFLFFDGRVKQADLAKLKNSYEKLTSWNEELYKYNAMVNEYNSKTKLANELIRNEPFWEDLLKELAILMPDNIVMGEFTFCSQKEISYGAVSLPLIITGVVIPRDTSPEEDLTKFLQNMEKSPYFRRIKLEYSKEAMYKEEKVLEFRIGWDIR